MISLLTTLLIVSFSAQANAETYASASGFLKLSERNFELGFLKKHCPEHELTVPHGEKRWKVVSVSTVAEEGGTKYFYQLCKGVDLVKGTPKAPSPQNNVAALLFTAEAGEGKLHLIWAETAESFGAEWFEPAKAVKTQVGKILVLPNPTGGNAGFNHDVFFLLKGSTAEMMDIDSWKKEVRAKASKGLILWNEIAPDLGTMSFQSPLWREGKDSHASPSGGKVQGKLGLEGNRLVVRSVEFEKSRAE